MNFYFLLEDEKSFLKTLPHWLESMNFPCKRVVDLAAITENTYVVQSGYGVTQLITNVLYETLDSIISSNKIINYLVIIADAEEYSVEHRFEEIKLKIKEYRDYDKINFKIKIIICNCCFETWLLGNADLFPKCGIDKSSKLYKHSQYYNPSVSDPEFMGIANYKVLNSLGYKCNTKAQYHLCYLQDMCSYNDERKGNKGKLKYSKSNPKLAYENGFLSKIENRIVSTDHLESFKYFYNFINKLIEEMNVI